MNRLTDNDKNWGPFTLARWKRRISAVLASGDDEDPENYLMVVCFGWALRMKLPTILKPCGKYSEYEREYGFAITAEGEGYDFVQVYFGPQTHDSSTTRNWCKHFPWKMWNHVRTTIYHPDGTFFANEEKGKWREFSDLRDRCPKAHFALEDYDGTKIIATCMIEEREWHRGEKWCSWLKYFYPVKIRRSLDIQFDQEMGPEKGSWKGGTIGHGIDMLPKETLHQAMVRYCTLEKRSKYKNYLVKFIGPCGPPPPRPPAPVDNEPVQAA